MALIKQSSPQASAARPFNMGDIEAHARSMLLKAKAQAEQLLIAAQAEADEMRKQAHAEGLAAGLAEGKKAGLAQGKTEGLAAGQKAAFDAEKAKLTELLQTFTAVTLEFDQVRYAILERADAELLPLALTIARKVTRRAGALDASVVEANAREAVRLLTSKSDVRLVVNPDQITLMQDVAAKLKQQWPQLTTITIEGDASVAPGGCRVHTVGGEIDADLDAQLDRIAAELLPEDVDR